MKINEAILFFIPSVDYGVATKAERMADAEFFLQQAVKLLQQHGEPIHGATFSDEEVNDHPEVLRKEDEIGDRVYAGAGVHLDGEAEKGLALWGENDRFFISVEQFIWPEDEMDEDEIKLEDLPESY